MLKTDRLVVPGFLPARRTSRAISTHFEVEIIRIWELIRMEALIGLTVEVIKLFIIWSMN